MAKHEVKDDAVSAAAVIRAKGWPVASVGDMSLVAWKQKDEGARLAVLVRFPGDPKGKTAAMRTDYEAMVASMTPQEFDRLAMEFTVWMVKAQEGGKLDG